MGSDTAALHRVRTAALLLETLAVQLVLGAIALAALDGAWPMRLAIAVAQGCWLHRVYFVGHEAVHRKLVPLHPWLNDALGQLALVALFLPLGVYRKIHRFHHACNRLDPHTSALDTFVVDPRRGPLTMLRCRVTWYLAVFAGGFFVHGLVSVLLFLALPLRVARRVSPAFAGWRARDRAAAIAALAFGVLVHATIARTFGAAVWASLCGWPIVAFAWVYSLMVYVYHYDTGYGRPTTANVRSVRAPATVSWWLLHFEEHATHHGDPSLPWYRLPVTATDDRSTRIGLARAIAAQLRGPRVIARDGAPDR